MYYEIVVTGKLNVTGVPDANGVLPKLIGAGHNRLFKVESGGKLRLNALNLTNGYSAQGDSDGNGGAVLVIGEESAFHATNAFFVNNKAHKDGGAVAVGGQSSVYLTNCSVASNTANRGGGIGSYTGSSYVEIRNSIVEDNVAAGYTGGGILSYNALSIYASIIRRNKGIQDNGEGGGIVSYGGNVRIEGSEISDNSNYRGGGIYSYHSRLVVFRSKIYRNTAKGLGGGIAMRNQKKGSAGPTRFVESKYSYFGLLLSQCFLVNNTAGNGGGIAAFSHAVSIGIVNTLFEGNDRNPNGNDAVATMFVKFPFPHRAYKNTALGRDMYFPPRESIFYASSHPLTVQLVNVTYQHNGINEEALDGISTCEQRPTQCDNLIPESQGQFQCVDNDAKSNKSGVVCVPSKYFSATNSSGNRTCNISTFGDYRVSSDCELYDTVTVETGKTLKLGGGSPPPSISGTFKKRLFLVLHGSTLILNSLILTRGHAFEGNGGAVFVGGENSLLNATNCKFIENVATALPDISTFGRGGAVALNDHAAANIFYCIFSKNTADMDGGGIHGADSVRLNINSSQFFENEAFAGYGGAIHVTGYSVLSLLSSELKYNSAYISGGGLNVYNRVQVLIQDCLIYGNVAGVRGGGIHFYYLHDTAIVLNSKIYSNLAAYDGGGVKARGLNTKVYLQESFLVNNSRYNGIGGAVYVHDAASVYFIDSYFHGNTGDDVGLVANDNVEAFVINQNKQNVSAWDFNSGGKAAVKSCSEAPSQCDYLYPTHYVCRDRNHVVGVDCFRKCNIPREGTAYVTTDCMVDAEIVVTGKLNVTGVPGADGALPKVIGGGSNRLFKVESGGELVVKFLNLTGGRISGGDHAGTGGFLHINGVASTFSCSKSVIHGHLSEHQGGAIYASGKAQVFIQEGCNFESNNAGGDGGGAIFLTGSGTIVNVLGRSLFQNNVATGLGGAINAHSSSKVNVGGGAIFMHNSARDGGAIRGCCKSELNIDTRTLIANNTAEKEGGGIHLKAASRANISHISILYNVAENGGGIYAGMDTNWGDGATDLYVRDSEITHNKKNDGAREDILFQKHGQVHQNSLYILLQNIAFGLQYAEGTVRFYKGNEPSTDGIVKNCSAAPTQCQDNGYPASYVCTDTPNPNEGVLCKPPCSISTSGRFTISQDCIQATQIYVVDFLEVVGIPSADGRLPKVHGGGSNRFFYVNGGDLVLESLELIGGVKHANWVKGGAIEVINNGFMQAKDCIFSKNTANSLQEESRGGAIGCHLSVVKLKNSMFLQNKAGNGGVLALYQCVFLAINTSYTKNSANYKMHATGYSTHGDGSVIRSYQGADEAGVIYLIGIQSKFRGNTMVIKTDSGESVVGGNPFSIDGDLAKLHLINLKDDAFETVFTPPKLQNVNANNPLYTQYCVDKPNPNEGVVCENLPPPCSILRAGNFTITSDCVMYYEIVVTGKLNVTGVPDANGVLPKLIGAGYNRLFKVESGGELVVRSLNLTGGVRTTTPCGSGNFDGCFGGIVYAKKDAVRFEAENSVFYGGKATYGGCVKVKGGTVNIITSSIIGCSAEKYGGGISVYPGSISSVSISDTIFDNNIAESYGGGIYVRGDGIRALVAIKDVVLRQNQQTECTQAYCGGSALFVMYNADVVVQESSFIENDGMSKVIMASKHSQKTFHPHDANPDIFILNTDFQGSITFAAYDGDPEVAVNYVSTQSCSAAPTQCEDNGYTPYYGCIDKPNPNEGVLCKPQCPIPTSGSATITSDCFLYNEIVVTGKLNVTGVPDAQGNLPKIIAGGVNRLFKVESGGELVVKRLNLDGGGTMSFNQNGQGVYQLSGSRFKAIWCIFSRLRANQNGGAAIYGAGAIIELLFCTFRSNSANDNGGAIYLLSGSNLNALSCNFTENLGQDNGGAIWVSNGGGSNFVNLLNCSFENNVANIEDNQDENGGGALYVSGPGFAQVSVTSCTFKNNIGNKAGPTSTNLQGGGAILIKSSLAIVYIQRSLFFENRAGNYATDVGGAIALIAGHLNISASTFDDNYASGNGDAIYSQWPIVLINTFVGASSNSINGTIQSCTTAPTQCQDNGYTPYYGCTDKPNPNEGVECELQCPIPTSGSATITSDCTLYNEIVVTGELNVNGVPDAEGNLPKIIGSGSNRLFTVASGGALMINGLNLTGGDATPEASKGGAIYCYQCNGNITIIDSILHSNTAVYGGGLYFYDGNILSITRSHITKNVGTHGTYGGGGLSIFGTGTLYIKDTLIDSNTAKAEGTYSGDNVLVNSWGSRTPTFYAISVSFGLSFENGIGGDTLASSCSDAPTQCQDNGFPASFVVCVDKPNPEEGVKCTSLLPCAIPTSGTVIITGACVLNNEIVVTGALNITGVPGTQGKRPRVIGGGWNRLFKVESGGELVVQGLSFRGGNATGTGDEGQGGFLHISGHASTFACYQSTISEHSSEAQGGAIVAYEGAQVFVHSGCVFEDNVAGGDGGGAIFSQGVNSVVNVTGASLFRRNRGQYGGAINTHTQSNLIVSNGAIFQNNQASGHGGAIRGCCSSTISISKSVQIRNNTAVGYGGGVFVEVGTTAYIFDSVIVDNKASGGGGLCAAANSFYGSIVTYMNVRNTKVSSNVANVDGHNVRVLKFGDSQIRTNLVVHLINVDFGASITPGSVATSDDDGEAIDYTIRNCSDSPCIYSTYSACFDRTVNGQANLGVECKSECPISTSGDVRITSDCTLYNPVVVTGALNVTGIPGSNGTVPKITGGGSNRLFSVKSGGNLVVRSLNFTGGFAGGSGWKMYGAAILNRDSALTVERSHFVNNHATGNGVVAIENGDFTLKSSVFVKNVGQNVFFAGHPGNVLSVVDSTFSQSAIKIYYDTGAAYLIGNTYLAGTGNIVLDQDFPHDDDKDSAPVIKNCTAAPTQCPDNGFPASYVCVNRPDPNEGVECNYPPCQISAFGKVLISENCVQATQVNVSGYLQVVGSPDAGGALPKIYGGGSNRFFFVGDGNELVLKRVELTGGVVNGDSGGAISVRRGYLRMENCDLNENLGGHGGAIFVLGGTILSFNSSYSKNVANSNYVHHANAIGGAIRSWDDGDPGNIYIVGERSSFRGNQLVFNEGEHQSGKAIEMCCSNAKLNLINTKDDAFEALSDIVYSLGASLENTNSGNALYSDYCVDKPNTNGGVVCQNLPPPCSILRAGNLTIISDCVLYYEVVVTGQLNVTGVPRADGALPKLIGAGHSRHFLVSNGAVLTIKHLHLYNGIRTSTPCGDGNDYSGCFGGSVYVTGDNSKLVAVKCLFAGNTAFYGGSIMAYSGSAAVILRKTNITNSSCSNYGGGVGLYSGTTSEMTDTRLENNVAEGFGGGAYVRGASLVMTRGIVIGNKQGDQNGASRGGGGLYLEYHSVVRIRESYIMENVGIRGHQIMTYKHATDDTIKPLITFINTLFKSEFDIGNFYGFHDGASNERLYVGTQSCTTAPAQCQDNGYPVSDLCRDRPDAVKGVICSQNCTPGYRINGVFNHTCEECPGGTFSMLWNQNTCLPWSDCATGQYVSINGTTFSDRVCASCLAGQFGTGMNQISCAPCEVGWYAGSTHSEECTKWSVCPEGEYISSSGNATHDLKCSACETGRYKESMGSMECIDWSNCPSGTYISNAGTTSSDRNCAACEIGRYTESIDTVECIAWSSCPSGKYMFTNGTATSDRTCAACDVGRYTHSTASVECMDWSDCHNGEYISFAGNGTHNRACSSCQSRTFSSANNVLACSNWTVCSVEEKLAVNGTNVSDAICIHRSTMCTAGKYWHRPQLSCAECDAGYYCPRTSTRRIPCPAGRFGNLTNQTSDKFCQGCQEGKYGNGNLTGQTNATFACPYSCMPGKYGRAPGGPSEATACAVCDYGKYTDTKGNTNCTVWKTCPAPDFYVNKLGTNAMSQGCGLCHWIKRTQSDNQLKCETSDQLIKAGGLVVSLVLILFVYSNTRTHAPPKEDSSTEKGKNLTQVAPTADGSARVTAEQWAQILMKESTVDRLLLGRLSNARKEIESRNAQKQKDEKKRKKKKKKKKKTEDRRSTRLIPAAAEP